MKIRYNSRCIQGLHHPHGVAGQHIAKAEITRRTGKLSRLPIGIHDAVGRQNIRPVVYGVAVQIPIHKTVGKTGRRQHTKIVTGVWLGTNDVKIRVCAHRIHKVDDRQRVACRTCRQAEQALIVGQIGLSARKGHLDSGSGYFAGIAHAIGVVVHVYSPACLQENVFANGVADFTCVEGQYTQLPACIAVGIHHCAVDA